MATETLQITVPIEVAERIRDYVRSGAYSSESEVVAERFSRNDDLDMSADEADEAFRLGYEALMELRAHPESAVTMKTMRADLEEQHRRRTQAA